MDWLLQKKELEKLRLNNYLLRQPHTLVPLQQVMQDLNWSKYLVLRHGEDLIADLNRLYSDTDWAINLDQQKHYFIVNSGKRIVEDTLRFDYLKRSHKHALIMSLFFETFTSPDEFADQHNMSLPYVRDLLRDVQLHLDSFQITITDDFMLVGNEKKIRYLFFRILFDYYYNQDNPFSPNTQAWIEMVYQALFSATHFTISQSMKIVMNFQLGLWYTRIRHHHIIDPLTSRPILPDIEDFPDDMQQFPITLRKLLQNTLGLTEEQAAHEARFTISALYAFGFSRKPNFNILLPTYAMALFSVINDSIRESISFFFANSNLLDATLWNAIRDDLYTVNLRIVYFKNSTRPKPNLKEAFSQFPIHAQFTLNVLHTVSFRTNMTYSLVLNTMFDEYFNTFITLLPAEETLPLVTITLDFVDNPALERRIAQKLTTFFSINVAFTKKMSNHTDLYISNIRLADDVSHSIVLRESPTLAEIEEIRSLILSITVAKFEHMTGNKITYIY